LTQLDLAISGPGSLAPRGFSLEQERSFSRVFFLHHVDEYVAELRVRPMSWCPRLRLLAGLPCPRGTETVQEDDESRRATDDKRVDELAQRLHEALLDRVRNVGVRSAAAARDVQTRMHPLTFTAPVSKADYLGDVTSLPSSSRRGNCPTAMLLEPAVLYIPSTAMYNAAMHTRVSSLAPRDA